MPEWQLPTSRDPAVLRAQLEWLKAEDRAYSDTIDELLTDVKRGTPEDEELFSQRLLEVNIARVRTLKTMSAIDALLWNVEVAPWIAALAPAPTTAVAPARGSGSAHVVDAANRVTAAASKKHRADDGDDAAEPVAPGCPSLLDAAAVLAPLRTAMQRVVDAACGVWFAGDPSERAALSPS